MSVDYIYLSFSEFDDTTLIQMKIINYTETNDELDIILIQFIN